MELVTFDFSTFHKYGPAFYGYLGLRKRHFVDNLKWDIPHNDAVEMDQYDNPLAHYSVVIKDGRIVGGARTAPTSGKWGAHTYMLKDAAEGRLPQIPIDVYQNIIESNQVWECTRLVVSDHLTTFEDRNTCLNLVVDGLAQTAESNGANQLISLSPITLARTLRSFGYPCQRISDFYISTDDNRKYAVLMMPAIKGFVQTKEAA